MADSANAAAVAPLDRDAIKSLVEEAVRAAMAKVTFEFIALPQFGGELVAVNRASPYVNSGQQPSTVQPLPDPDGSPSRIHAQMTFKQAAPLWLRTRKPFLATNTYERKRHHLTQLNQFFGEHTLVRCADPDLVREYQDKRRARAGGDCINHELQVLAEILRRVGLWKQLADDYQPLPVKPSTAGRALSPIEEKKFVKAANSNPDWQVAYWVAVLAAHTLLSPSEIFPRQLQDVDLRKPAIIVRKGKTQYRAREVPLNAHALRAAKLLVSRAKELGAWRPEHFLLPYRVKVGFYDPARPARGCRSAWRALTRSIGLFGLRVKDMRHHGITVLDENKTSSRVMKSLAGHSPNSRLLDRYSHPRMNAKKAAVRVLEHKVKIA